jgi:hypothetical protein
MAADIIVTGYFSPSASGFVPAGGQSGQVLRPTGWAALSAGDLAGLAVQGVSSVATPSRSLGSAFQPSATRPVLAIYSARVSCVLTLTSGQAGRVELLSDAANPPTTIRARVAGGCTGTLSVGLALTDTAEAPLVYLVPAAHYVLLRSVNETGTPTYSLTTQAEETL